MVLLDSTVRGKALATSEENESMTMSPVFSGGKLGVEWANSAMRCESVGAVMCMRLSKRSFGFGGNLSEEDVEIEGRYELEIRKSLGPGTG